MLLSDIFSNLGTLELSPLYIGNAEQNTIEPEHYAKVINAINLGLTALYD